MDRPDPRSVLRGPWAGLCVLLACASTPPATEIPPPAPVATSAPAGDEAAAPRPSARRAPQGPPPPVFPANEASVRPGVNDAYRKGPVDRFVARFEGPDREVAAHKSDILAFLDLRPKMVVADVGAGTGLYTFDLAEAVGPDGRVYAVDVTPSFLDHLRAEKAKRGASNVTVVEADAKDAHLPEASVDLALLCDVYHHLEYPRTYLASVYRALRPGGTLVIVDFRRDPKTSPEWVLSHVRAGQDDVRAEVESVGFLYVGEGPPLSQNYVMAFRKPTGEPAASH